MMKLLRSLLVVSVNLLIAFVAAEGLLRFFPELIPPTLLRYFNSDIRAIVAQQQGRLREADMLVIERDDGGAPHRLLRFKPFSMHGKNRMDGMGFCNAPGNLYEKHENFEIIAVGDSFTYCWQVRPEEAWPSLLSASTGLSVYNLGIPTIGPYEYVQLIKSFGIQKKPKLVIMHIYGGNDLRDALKYYEYRNAATPSGESEQAQSTANQSNSGAFRDLFFRSLQSWPAKNSYAFNTVVTGAGAIYSHLTSRSEGGDTNFRYRVVIDGRQIALNTANVDSEEPSYAERLQEGQVSLEAFTDALRSFVDLSREHGFTPVVSYMPAANIVYRDSVVFEEPELAPLMQWFHDEQVEYFGNKSRELGFEFIDLTTSMISAVSIVPDNTLLYIPNDLHPTVYSQRIVANALSRHLTERGLAATSPRFQ